MTVFHGFAAPTKRYVIQNTYYRAELWPELGGAVASFDYIQQRDAITPLFRPTPDQAHYMPTDLSCWPLLPYSNRIAFGRFALENQDFTLELNVANHPHALHGFGWQRPWDVLSHDTKHCVMGLSHVADSFWPFACQAEQSFVIEEDGLTISLALTNLSQQTMPCGLGQHPYIVRPRGTRLFAPVKGVWLTDDTVIPTHYGAVPPMWDLPNGCLLDDIFMDNCFDGLAGEARVVWPDGRTLAICGSAELNYLVVYNPPDADYVCVEPVSHLPNAVNQTVGALEKTGLTMLSPGKTVVATHRFSHRISQVQ